MKIKVEVKIGELEWKEAKEKGFHFIYYFRDLFEITCQILKFGLSNENNYFMPEVRP